MRLLNTKTLEFKEFQGSNIPRYAILSHVWSDNEVSYEDYLAGHKKDGYGYKKILKLCELANDPTVLSYVSTASEERGFGKIDSLEWDWIDTSCIDKRSSAELSEAINSMFKWYQNAQICLVFLPDVHPLTSDNDAVVGRHGAGNVAFSEHEFRNSVWFTRGWTLQELIAPTKVFFYNTAFEFIGHKIEGASDLADLIAVATGIDIAYELDFESSDD